MVSSERLKALHELAARTKAQEAELKRNTFPLTSAMRRLIALRAIELRGTTMTPAEFAEWQRHMREIERDNAEGDLNT